jgi:hypothetical protein
VCVQLSEIKQVISLIIAPTASYFARILKEEGINILIWLAFTTFPAAAISEAQYQINGIIKKYIEGENKTNRQKQGYLSYYATECWKGLKIIHQNSVSKVKSGFKREMDRRKCETFL